MAKQNAYHAAFMEDIMDNMRYQGHAESCLYETADSVLAESATSGLSVLLYEKGMDDVYIPSSYEPDIPGILIANHYKYYKKSGRFRIKKRGAACAAPGRN